ncbi:MAG: DUF5615 family PIN-like protein [Ignavibacteria bacterium]|nr:DUF5615 family PIN-like protein [Ignavibacteria bacterium]
MRFIVDTQLPASLSQLFVELGFDSVHTTNFPDGHLISDNEIIEIAINQNRIIVSKDKDFFDYYFLKGIPPRILLIKTGNIKNDVLINLIKLNINSITTKFLQDANLIILSSQELISF